MTASQTTSLSDALDARSGPVGQLGLACLAVALVSGVLNGVWELASPNFTQPGTIGNVSAIQLWGHAVLEVVKTAGFFAGLVGFWLVGTGRGRATKTFLVLAALGGLFYIAIHLWIAATGRFTLLYVLGGMWYQMIAPAALGIALSSPDAFTGGKPPGGRCRPYKFTDLRPI